MSDLESIIRENKVENLIKVLSTSSSQQQYICLTKVHLQELIIEAISGTDVWTVHLNDSNIDEQKELNGTATVEKFLQIISNAFTNAGTIAIDPIGTKLRLTFGKEASSVSLDLFEAKASEKRSEVQAVLLSLANRVLLLEAELSRANDQVNSLKAQKYSNSVASPLATSSNPIHNTSKPKVNKAGMSVVNPSSKKRKAAAGVVFDTN